VGDGWRDIDRLGLDEGNGTASAPLTQAVTAIATILTRESGGFIVRNLVPTATLFGESLGSRGHESPAGNHCWLGGDVGRLQLQNIHLP
jgi:hypothetical protein